MQPLFDRLKEFLKRLDAISFKRLVWSFAALLIVAIVFVTPLRDGVAWFYAHMIRMMTDDGRSVTEILGKSTTPGLLYIDAPQIYTRERLVNDRFGQANWLNERLKDTSGEKFNELFGKAQSIDSESDNTKISLALKNEDTGNSNKSKTPSSAEKSPQLELDPLDVFHRSLAYRAELRNELMGTLLDDGHDIDGNTLYRLNFDAVASPWRINKDSTASALFIIKARQAFTELADQKKRTKEELDKLDPEDIAQEKRFKDRASRQRLEDDLELLRNWERQIQHILNRILGYRVETFKKGGMLESASDPKEQVAFDWFMRMKMVEKFLQLMVEHLDVKFDCTGDDAEACKKMKAKWGENDKTDIIAKWLGLKYRKGNPSPDFVDARHNISFKRSIEQARLVNAAWYFEGLPENDRACAAQLGLALPKSPSENAGEANSNDPNGYVQPSGSQQNKSSKGNISNLPPCTPLPDISGQRALLRIIAVVETMRLKLEEMRQNSDQKTKERLKKLFTFSYNEKNKDTGNPQGFEKLMAEFVKTTPSVVNIDHWLKQRIDQKNQLLKDRDKIERLLKDGNGGIKRALIDPKITSLTKVDLDIEDCESISDFAEWGSCIFIRTKSSTFVESIIAGFLEFRVKGEHPLYSPVDSMVNFIDLNVVGCGITQCAFEVRRMTDLPTLEKIDPEVFSMCESDVLKYLGVTKIDNKNLIKWPHHIRRKDHVELFAACHLRHWLKNKRNHLAVYDVSPRAHSEVTLGEQRRANEVLAKLPLLLNPNTKDEMALTIKQVRDHISRNKSAQPFVIGYGQIGKQDADHLSKPRDETAFGWLVHARPGANDRQARGHHRISAVLSIPSWWKRIEFDVMGCWVGPGLVRDIDISRLDDPTEICMKINESKKDESAILKRTFRIQLPRRVEDVAARFKFDVIKTPYIDFDYFRNNRESLMLEQGRPGRLVLVGERLWRGTVVTVGTQRADRISVLPDMKGVIAEFKCVEPLPGTSGMPRPSDEQNSDGEGPKKNEAVQNQDANEATTATKKKPTNKNKEAQPPHQQRKVIVWTSEGRTTSLNADMVSFTPRYTGEKPCLKPDFR